MTIASIHGDTEFIRVYNFLKFCISFQAIENLLSLYYFLLSDKDFPYETEIYWYFLFPLENWYGRAFTYIFWQQQEL